MKIEIWKLNVYEGTMAFIHDSYFEIIEFYIPELDLGINDKNFFIINDNTRYTKTNESTPSPEKIGEFDSSQLDTDTISSLKAMKKARQCYDKVLKTLNKAFKTAKKNQ